VAVKNPDNVGSYAGAQVFPVAGKIADNGRLAFSFNLF
jgi:hypothetical protein